MNYQQAWSPFDKWKYLVKVPREQYNFYNKHQRLVVKSLILQSTASMQLRRHITNSSNMITSTTWRSIANWLSDGTLQGSGSLHRMHIFVVYCAVLPPQKSPAATAEGTTAIMFLTQSCGKSWIALVANVLPVPPDASNRNRGERYEEWGWMKKGEEWEWKCREVEV